MIRRDRRPTPGTRVGPNEIIARDGFVRRITRGPGHTEPERRAGGQVTRARRRLAARRGEWDAMGSDVQKGTKRPGSLQP